MYSHILDKCNSNKSGYFIKESGFKKTWPNLYKKIIEYPFIDELANKEFKIRVWHYLNQIFEIPKKECGNLLHFKNFKIGYSNFCFSNCKCMSKYSTNKKRNNNLLKYGVDHPMKLEENREMIKQIKLSYSDEKNCEINEKRKSSYLKKYGVDNPAKSKEILERRISTFKSNSKKFKESYKKTSLERYGTEHPWANENVRKKYKNTMIKKYGEDNPNKVNAIKNTIKNTNNLKYGCDYTVQSNIVKEKIKNTLLEKYGVDNPSHIQKVKEKISIGVKNAIKRNLIKKYPNIISFNDDMKTLHIKCEDKCICGGVI